VNTCPKAPGGNVASQNIRTQFAAFLFVEICGREWNAIKSALNPADDTELNFLIENKKNNRKECQEPSWSKVRPTLKAHKLTAVFEPNAYNSGLKLG
jgi:hypothetical protein